MKGLFEICGQERVCASNNSVSDTMAQPVCLFSASPPFVKRICHLCTRNTWPEQCASCVRSGAVVSLRFQCKNEMESGLCLVWEEDLRCFLIQVDFGHGVYYSHRKPKILRYPLFAIFRFVFTTQTVAEYPVSQSHLQCLTVIASSIMF